MDKSPVVPCQQSINFRSAYFTFAKTVIIFGSNREILKISHVSNIYIENYKKNPWLRYFLVVLFFNRQTDMSPVWWYQLRNSFSDCISIACTQI